jgi:hypothetical protein
MVSGINVSQENSGFRSPWQVKDLSYCRHDRGLVRVGFHETDPEGPPALYHFLSRWRIHSMLVRARPRGKQAPDRIIRKKLKLVIPVFFSSVNSSGQISS